MSDYYGNAELLSYLEHEVLGIPGWEKSLSDDFKTYVKFIFKPFSQNIESNIEAWMDDVDTDGNRFSWRGCGRGLGHLNVDELHLCSYILKHFETTIKVASDDFDRLKFLTQIHVFIPSLKPSGFRDWIKVHYDPAWLDFKHHAIQKINDLKFDDVEYSKLIEDYLKIRTLSLKEFKSIPIEVESSWSGITKEEMVSKLKKLSDGANSVRDFFNQWTDETILKIPELEVHHESPEITMVTAHAILNSPEIITSMESDMAVCSIRPAAKFDHLTVDLNRPVVFLDMDGVVNGALMSKPWYFANAPIKKFGIDWVDMQKANYLDAILSNHNCQVIVVSSWGSGFKPKDHECFKYIRQALPHIDIIGSTYCGGGKERGDIVLECIQHFNLKKYVIVDDAMPMYRHLSELHGHWINPHGRYGMTDANFEDLDNLLTRFKIN